VPGRALDSRATGRAPGHRIEWWYVTGHLEARLGFQVTFFRVRNPDAEGNPAAFAPSQLLFAHAAFADPAEGSCCTAEVGAPAAGLVEASTRDTAVRIDDWTLAREARPTARASRPRTSPRARARPTQAPLLQGERGFSRKGASAAHASYYYSEPQLA
jgi:predicted secreted hydrolase